MLSSKIVAFKFAVSYKFFNASVVVKICHKSSMSVKNMVKLSIYDFLAVDFANKNVEKFCLS